MRKALGAARLRVGGARRVNPIPITPGGVGFVELGLTGVLIAFGAKKRPGSPAAAVRDRAERKRLHITRLLTPDNRRSALSPMS